MIEQEKINDLINYFNNVSINFETQDLIGCNPGLVCNYSGKKQNFTLPSYFFNFLLNESQLPIEWKKVEKGLDGYFSTPEYDYIIRLYKLKYMQYDLINVSFEINKEGKAITNLTPTSFRHQVLGTIQNALAEKIIMLDIDAILIAAEDNIEARMSLYGKMADKLAKGFGQVIKNVKLTTGEAIVIISNRILQEDIEKLKVFIEKMNVKKPNKRSHEPARRNIGSIK